MRSRFDSASPSFAAPLKRRSLLAAGSLAVLVGGVGVAIPGRADPMPVTGDAIREAVVGRTVDLDTPLGTPITIVYKENGLLSGSANAALGMYLGSSTDRGRWWVENGRLCQKFFKWLEAETSCLRIRQDGRRIFWTRDDGKTGTATVYANAAVHAAPPRGLGGAAFAAAVPVASVRHVPDHPAGGPPVASRPVLPAILAVTKAPPVAAMPPAPMKSPSWETETSVLRPVPVPVALRADPDPPRVRAGAAPLARPEWPAQQPSINQARMVRAMIVAARHEHARHRWCHEVHDFRLLARPQAVDAEAPELLTAWRHMVAPEISAIPAASCIVPAPALMDISRQLIDGR